MRTGLGVIAVVGIASLTISREAITQQKAPVSSGMGSVTGPGVTSVIGQITQDRTVGSANVPFTATGWEHAANILLMQAESNQPPGVLVFPKDSIRSALSGEIKKWLSTLGHNQRSGIYADSYGRLLVKSNQDAAAQETFKARLASSGMSMADSAFTLVMAIQAFADPDIPTRIPTAQSYMNQLDTFGSDANYWKFQGHYTLFNAHFMLGNRDAFMRHAEQAIKLVPGLFFKTRGIFYFGGANLYMAFADELSRSPEGLAKLESINKELLDATAPSATLVALDSTFFWMGMGYKWSLERISQFSRQVRRPAPSIIGTSWLNMPDTGKYELKLNDGIIRMIGIGGLDQAVYRIPALERVISQTNADGKVQPAFLIPITGHWGVKFVTPEEETLKIKEYFTVRYPAKVPLAIWAGPKERTNDGGMLPSKSPTIAALNPPFLPVTIITDKAGNIRRIFLGVFSREDEAQAIAVIRNLLNE